MVFEGRAGGCPRGALRAEGLESEGSPEVWEGWTRRGALGGRGRTDSQGTLSAGVWGMHSAASAEGGGEGLCGAPWRVSGGWALRSPMEAPRGERWSWLRAELGPTPLCARALLSRAAAGSPQAARSTEGRLRPLCCCRRAKLEWAF